MDVISILDDELTSKGSKSFFTSYYYNYWKSRNFRWSGCC